MGRNSPEYSPLVLPLTRVGVLPMYVGLGLVTGAIAVTTAVALAVLSSAAAPPISGANLAELPRQGR